MTFAETVSKHVKDFRMEKFNSVQEACHHSAKLAKKKKISEEITMPRWYRLEQGTHPRMVASVIDDVAVVLGVNPSELTGEIG